MALLKEDGSLDMNWLNSLPIEEFDKEFGKLTQEQADEFWARIPINESKGHTQSTVVECSFEEELERGTIVNAVCFLNKQREKYGTNR